MSHSLFVTSIWLSHKHFKRSSFFSKFSSLTMPTLINNTTQYTKAWLFLSHSCHIHSVIKACHFHLPNQHQSHQSTYLPTYILFPLFITIDPALVQIDIYSLPNHHICSWVIIFFAISPLPKLFLTLWPWRKLLRCISNHVTSLGKSCPYMSAPFNTRTISLAWT